MRGEPFEPNDPGPQGGPLLRTFSPLFSEIGEGEDQEGCPYGGKSCKLHGAEGFVVEEDAQKEGEAGGEVLAEAQYVQGKMVGAGGEKNQGCCGDDAGAHEEPVCGGAFSKEVAFAGIIEP